MWRFQMISTYILAHRCEQKVDEVLKASCLNEHVGQGDTRNLNLLEKVYEQCGFDLNLTRYISDVCGMSPSFTSQQLIGLHLKTAMPLVHIFALPYNQTI